MPTAFRPSPRKTMTTPPSASVLSMPRIGYSRWNCSGVMPPDGWPRSLGPQAVPLDKQMRVLGLYRAAEAEIPYLSSEVNRAFRAYAAGVNDFLASRRAALPPEFLLLHFRPEPWHEADSLVWGKLMSLQLDGNYRGELLRAQMARTIPPADMAFSTPNTRRMRRPPWPRCCRSTAGWRSAGSMICCRRRPARITPRTIGWSTASTAPAASRFSPTTRISPLARRASGISPG